MEMAQDIFQHTFGVFLLIWVVGYTILRTQEAISKIPASSKKKEAGKEDGEQGSPSKWSFDFAQRRRRDGKLDAPLFGVAAGAKALADLVTRPFRRKNSDGTDKSDRSRTGKKRVKGDRPEASGRPGTGARPGAGEARPEDRANGKRAGSEEPPGREGTTEDRREGGKRWRPFDEDLADEEIVEEMFRRARGAQERDGSAVRPDITVEEVPRYGPRDPELERPIRALYPPGGSPGPWPGDAPRPGGGPQLGGPQPGSPQLGGGQPDEDYDYDIEVIKTENERTTPIMSGGEPLAIPGLGNDVAVPSGGGAPITSGGGEKHDDDKELARQIIKAMRMTGNPITEACRMVEVTIAACWELIDRFQHAGIRGSILERWADVIVSYNEVLATLKVAERKYEESMDNARSARARQASIGDDMQDVVSREPQAVATHTSYYGKS